VTSMSPIAKKNLQPRPANPSERGTIVASFMNRPTFFGLALAATALLVVGATDASASTSSAVSAESAASTETATSAEAPSAPAQPPPATPVVPTPTVPSSGTGVSTGTGTATTPAATTPTTPAAPSQSTATSNATPPTAGEVVPAATAGGQTPGSGTQAGVAGSPARTTGTQAELPAAGRITASAPPSAPIAPSPIQSGVVRPAPAMGQSGAILERTLPAVERRLRGVQTQMNDLQRRLAENGSASSTSLSRLRRSLELIAPALVAIGVQVNDAGPLSPHLQDLLNRVGTRLDGTQRSAAALANALRASGVHGPELDLLLRELQNFQGMSPAFLSSAQLTATAPVYAPHVAYTQAPPAAASAPAPPAPAPQAARPERAAATSGASASQQPAAPDALVQQVTASGSASAGPGGGFSAAGLAAALAALLGVLALPRLLSRVQLAPMRCYAAIFLVPLQRPG
jgi:hypothetical protein